MSLWQEERECNNKFGKQTAQQKMEERKHLVLAVLHVSLGSLLMETEALCSVHSCWKIVTIFLPHVEDFYLVCSCAAGSSSDAVSVQPH